MRAKRLSTFWKNIFSRPHFLFEILAVAVLFLIFFLPGKVIRVNEIECQTQYGDCRESARISFEDFRPSTLNETKKRIGEKLSGNSQISDYSVQYTFPDKLRVDVVLKKAKYAIYDKESGKYLILDLRGEVLSTADNSSLPTVVQNGPSPNMFALKLMEGVFNMYQINRGEIRGESLVVDLPSGKSVIFPLEGDSDILLGSLRLIYSQVSDREIDLRFKNPVLR